MKALNVKTYVQNVLQNTSTHLNNFNAMLMLVKLRISSQHIGNVQIAEDKYASQVAVSVCQKLYTRTVELRDLVDRIRKGESSIKVKAPETNKRNSRVCYFKKFLMVSLVLGAAFTGMKYYRSLSR